MIRRGNRSGTPTRPVTGPATRRRRMLGAAALLPLFFLAAMPAGAQELPSFAILAGASITNTGPTTITGNIGLSPGLSFTGQVDVTQTGAQYIGDAVAARMQADLTTLYNVLAGRPTSALGDLTGQDLGGMTLSPGVYSFDSSAFLTGPIPLTLDGGGDPNAVFIFNITSTLITGPDAVVFLDDGAQAGNVFFRVGSSATLDTGTVFQGTIVALSSITLNTAATIPCGAALARNGAVTLDTNTIGVCDFTALTFEDALGDDDTQLSDNAQAVADALDDYVDGGGTLPSGFAILALTLTPTELAAALAQLSGEVATGVAPTGMQAMDSFLDLVLTGGGGLPMPVLAAPPTASPGPPASPGTVSTLGYGPESAAANDAMFAAYPDGTRPRNWTAWAGAYGGRSTVEGDSNAGTHERTSRDYGVAFGIDYLVDPYSTVGFAFAVGGASFDLADDFGSGSSETYHAAIRARTETDTGYFAGALAYGFNDVSSERTVTIAGTDRFAASFDAHNVAGHIEGGYKLGWLTPYAAVRGQVFMTPDYSERTVAGVSTFALDYEARTATAIRSELGIGAQWSLPVDGGALAVRARGAWAHDYGDGNDIEAAFQSIPGSHLTTQGAEADRDSLLLSAGAGVSFYNGFFVNGGVDSRIAVGGQAHSAKIKLGFTW